MSKWKVVQKWIKNPQGEVWIVRDWQGNKGYFKIPGKNKYYGGTMIANEIIAAALAKKLGLPVAKLSIVTINGPNGRKKTGIISHPKKAKEVITWSQASHQTKRHPTRYVANIQKLSQMLVFDAWIMNVDREMGKNLILYRNHKTEKYSWYLIDHGNTLYGSPYKWKRGKWNSKLWYHLWKYYNIPQGLLQIQNSSTTLMPMIKKIESMTLANINHAILQAPYSSLSTHEREKTRKILLSRKDKLQFIIKRWLTYQGVKEYGSR